jgi:hypothetical protein
MLDTLYAVHTRTCTYLLDEEGVCRWVLSPSGAPAEVSCVGAQFVACLDFRVDGGLVGELLVGASALFVRIENGRAGLLRTSPIEHVEFKRPSTIADPQTAPFPAPPDDSEEEIDLDVEDLSTYSSEVTRTMPLYRPQVQDRSGGWTAATPATPATAATTGSSEAASVGKAPTAPLPATWPGWPSGWDGNNRG